MTNNNELEKLKSALINTNPENFKEEEYCENSKSIDDYNWKSLLNNAQSNQFNYSYGAIPPATNSQISGLTGPQGSNVIYSNTLGVNGTSGPISSNSNGSFYTVNNSLSTLNPTLHVDGDAEIKGKLTVNGVNVIDLLEAIERRLAILIPDPEKLEHYEALQKAYAHYKTLEALCTSPDKKEEK